MFAPDRPRLEVSGRSREDSCSHALAWLASIHDTLGNGGEVAVNDVSKGPLGQDAKQRTKSGSLWRHCSLAGASCPRRHLAHGSASIRYCAAPKAHRRRRWWHMCVVEVP